MNLHAFRELCQEQILIDIVNAEFLQDRAQICLVDELLCITLLFEQANGVDHGAEYSLVLKQFRADGWKCLAAWHIEGCGDSFKVVQPSVQVDEGLILLVKAEVICEAANHIGSDIGRPDLL